MIRKIQKMFKWDDFAGDEITKSSLLVSNDLEAISSRDHLAKNLVRVP